MTAFQQRWVERAKRFGLRVRIPYEVDLEGDRLTVPVLLEEFGPPRGMLLVVSYGDVDAFTERIMAAGYGYSCLGEPTEEDIDQFLALRSLATSSAIRVPLTTKRASHDRSVAFARNRPLAFTDSVRD